MDDENFIDRGRPMRMRTVWSDASWLATATLPSGLHEARFFAPDRYRATWSLVGVRTPSWVGAIEDHDVIVDIITEDLHRRLQRIHPVGCNGPRCPVEHTPRRWWPRRRPLLRVAPWVDPRHVDPSIWDAGFTQPWVHPKAHQLHHDGR